MISELNLDQRTSWTRKRLTPTLLLSVLIAVLAWPAAGWCAGRDATMMRAVGGWSYDSVSAVRATPDGGFVAAGVSNSLGDDQGDLLMLKYDGAGELQWARTAAVGTSLEIARDVRLTSDGGYIVAGETYSTDARNELLLLKYNASGGVQWARTTGAGDNEFVGGIAELAGGDFAVAGTTESYGVGTTVFYTLFSSAGDLLGFYITGSGGDDTAHGICATSDGGFVVAGETTSYDSSGDAMLIKYNASGGRLWFRTFGGAQGDVARSVLETPDGGLLVAGETGSFGPGDANVFLFKTDADGHLLWAATIGGATGEGAYAIRRASDGGYLVSGYTASFSHGSYDLYLIRCDHSGYMEWARAVGGAGMELAFTVDETADGGYIMAGETSSFGAGVRDVMLVKTDPDGMIYGCPYFDDCGPVQDSAEAVEGTHYPPNGFYAQSAASPYVYQSSPVPAYENVCGGSTVSVAMECSPPDGILPFTLHFDLAVNNEFLGFTRRIGARLQAELANGTVYPNWKQGTMNLGPGESFTAGFNQYLPDVPALQGPNTFTLSAVDITPAPYNQPPYPPSGDTDSDQCRVYGLP